MEKSIQNQIPKTEGNNISYESFAIPPWLAKEKWGFQYEKEEEKESTFLISEIHGETEKAIMVSKMGSNFWLPKSQIQKWSNEKHRWEKMN